MFTYKNTIIMNQQIDIKLTLLANAELTKVQVKRKIEDMFNFATKHSTAHERMLIPEINIVDIKEEAEIYDVEASHIIKEAFDHVKNYHPNINLMVFNREGKWLCMDDDYDTPEFSQDIDTTLLHRAADAAYKAFGLPYVYQEIIN